MSDTKKADTNPYALANPGLVTKALQAVDAARTKYNNAQADLQTIHAGARAADAAVTAHAADVADGAELDATKLAALTASKEKVAFHERVVATLGNQVEAAKEALKTAQYDAYSPVYDAGRAARLAAAERIDAARNEIARAIADYAKGTAVINFAFERGVPHPAMLTRGPGDTPIAALQHMDFHKLSAGTLAYSTAEAERTMWGAVL